MVDDGIFLPGSTYQELHKTLRNHAFLAARLKPPSRHRSPERVSLANQQDGGSKLSSEIAEPEQSDPEVHSEGSPMPPESTQQQEYTLWKNSIDEISAWVGNKLEEDLLGWTANNISPTNSTTISILDTLSPSWPGQTHISDIQR